MAVHIMRGNPKYDYHSMELPGYKYLKVGRSTLSNITSTWAKEHYPGAKYVANYTIINIVTGDVDFIQIYF